MSKLTKDFFIEHDVKGEETITLEVRGKGYFHESEVGDERFSYDIETICIKGEAFREKVSLFAKIVLDDILHEPIIRELYSLFIGNQEEEDTTTDRNQGEVDIFGRLTEYFHFQHGC